MQKMVSPDCTTWRPMMGAGGMGVKGTGVTTARNVGDGSGVALGSCVSVGVSVGGSAVGVSVAGWGVGDGTLSAVVSVADGSGVGVVLAVGWGVSVGIGLAVAVGLATAGIVALPWTAASVPRKANWV